MRTFEPFAGSCAIAAGIGGFLYAIAFIVLVATSTTGIKTLGFLLLLAGGILSIVVFVALYQRLRAVDEGFALCALAFGVISGAGATIHGGYDLGLATFEGDPVSLSASAIDPRGLLTFGFAAFAIGIYSWLARRSGALPDALGRLGLLSALLLVIIYLGRLLIFDPTNPLLLVAALVEGLLVNPAWYIWVGRELRKTDAVTAP